VGEKKLQLEYGHHLLKRNESTLVYEMVAIGLVLEGKDRGHRHGIIVLNLLIPMYTTTCSIQKI
jgi:hypothetical protein